MTALVDGEVFTTPQVEVTEDLRADLVRLGGYTHPLFTRPQEVALPGGSPLPGQAVLLLMGGLVEQSDRLDDAVALVGLTDVRFRRPAVPGCRLQVEVTVLGHAEARGGRSLRSMRWRALDGGAEVLVEATVLMLVNGAA